MCEIDPFRSGLWGGDGAGAPELRQRHRVRRGGLAVGDEQPVLADVEREPVALPTVILKHLEPRPDRQFLAGEDDPRHRRGGGADRHVEPGLPLEHLHRRVETDPVALVPESDLDIERRPYAVRDQAGRSFPHKPLPDHLGSWSGGSGPSGGM